MLLGVKRLPPSRYVNLIDDLKGVFRGKGGRDRGICSRRIWETEESVHSGIRVGECVGGLRKGKRRCQLVNDAAGRG